ncbi:MAG: argininosuccinate lyase [Thermodesulfovibrionales bacterium]|nr:argininosuccinate lyase [Thermodesulfovibrionales bacterium]
MKKPWSGRFKGATARSVEAFTESVSFDARLAPYDIQGSIAHARMLGQQGIIRKSEAGAIIKGLKEIASEVGSGKFKFKEALEDVHMNIESALIKKIGPVGGKLHTARSRNDQVALDLRLYLRDEVAQTISLVRSLQKSLLKQAEKHLGLIMPGYTHLQRAQPVLLSHHLLAYVEMLERDVARLQDAQKRINVLPLGSGALAGTSLPIDRKAVARELGFDSVALNSMDAVSDRDFALETVFALALVMTHLSRLGEEIVLWASEEFSFISLPDAYATGSSIMPQKKNPDIAELVRGKAGRAIGNLMALLAIMKGLPLAYNRDLQEDKPPVFDSVDTAKASLSVIAEMMSKVRFNKSRMYEAAAKGFSTATDVAEYLVRKGMPFREAHEVTGRIVAFCLKKEKELHGLSISQFRLHSKLFRKDVLGCLSAEDSIGSRDSEGGTSFKQVRKQIARHKRRLSR